MRKEYDFAKLKGRRNPSSGRLRERRNSMRKIKLTKEERAIEQSLEEYVPVHGRELREIVAALEWKKKKIRRKRVIHPAD